MLSELYSKMHEKWQKTGFTRNAKISKAKKIFSSKFYTKFSEAGSQFMLKFKVYIFRTDKEIIPARPGWAGPVHYG